MRYHGDFNETKIIVFLFYHDKRKMWSKKEFSMDFIGVEGCCGLRKSSAWICSSQDSINVHFLELTTTLPCSLLAILSRFRPFKPASCLLLLCNSPLFSPIHFYPFFRLKADSSFLSGRPSCLLFFHDEEINCRPHLPRSLTRRGRALSVVKQEAVPR